MSVVCIQVVGIHVLHVHPGSEKFLASLSVEILHVYLVGTKLCLSREYNLNIRHTFVLLTPTLHFYHTNTHTPKEGARMHSFIETQCPRLAPTLSVHLSSHPTNCPLIGHPPMRCRLLHPIQNVLVHLWATTSTLVGWAVAC